MKTLTFIMLSIIVCFSSLYSQTRTEYSKSLSGIRVVVLSTSGYTSLQSSSSEKLTIQSTLQSTGKVYGWKWPSIRPAFCVKQKVSGDTLYIFTPEKCIPASIGVNTYNEIIDNNILVPKSARVLILHADELKVADDLFNVRTIDVNKK